MIASSTDASTATDDGAILLAEGGWNSQVSSANNRYSSLKGKTKALVIFSSKWTYEETIGYLPSEMRHAANSNRLIPPDLSKFPGSKSRSRNSPSQNSRNAVQPNYKPYAVKEQQPSDSGHYQVRASSAYKVYVLSNTTPSSCTALPAVSRPYLNFGQWRQG